VLSSSWFFCRKLSLRSGKASTSAKMWPFARNRSWRPSRSASRKRDAPAHALESARREPRGRARVLELRAVQVPKERLGVVSEGGEHEVEPAVAVVVAGVDAHAGLRPALAVHCDAGQEPDALEAPASQVVVQEVRIRVVGHEEVDLAVAVVVGRDDAEAVGLRGVREAGGRGSLDERAVPPVQEEEVLLARQPRRADHDVGTVAPDERPLRGDDLVPAGLHVARDVEVEIAVGVGVEERAARAPAGGRDTGRRGHVLEGAVALVAKEEVGAPVRDVEVERAVAVVVARADAVCPTRPRRARLLRDVLEPSARRGSCRGRCGAARARGSS
jgi:hypothetical protein